MSAKRVVQAGFFVLWAVMLASAALAGEVMRPHQAAYELNLARVSGRSGVRDVTGVMLLKFAQRGCKGWDIILRMTLRYVLDGNVVRVNDTISRAFEARDGAVYTYRQSERTDGKRQKEILLKVRRGAGAPGYAGEMKKPARRTFSLPDGVVFPAAHQMRVMAAAAAGRSIDRSILFDGSDEDKTYKAVTFIGPPATVARPQHDLLSNEKMWPVSISYFARSGKRALVETPIYQAQMRLYGNGVADAMRLAYPDFTITGKLARLQYLPMTACP